MLGWDVVTCLLSAGLDYVTLIFSAGLYVSYPEVKVVTLRFSVRFKFLASQNTV